MSIFANLSEKLSATLRKSLICYAMIAMNLAKFRNAHQDLKEG